MKYVGNFNANLDSYENMMDVEDTSQSTIYAVCVTAAKMPDRRLPPVGPMPAVPVSPERRQVPSLSLMLCHGPQHSTAFHFSPGIAQTPAASGKP